jgi:hypothetical protein
LREIEIPSIPVSDDFYVVFYDRGSMRIVMDAEDEPENHISLMILIRK